MPDRIPFKALTGSLFALGAALFLSWLIPGSAPEPVASESPEAEPETVVTYDAFGLPLGAFEITKHTIRRNQTFSGILSSYDVAPETVHVVAEAARPVFDVRRLRAGRPLHVYRDSLQRARVVVYEQDPVHYVVFDLRDSVHVYTGMRPVTIAERTVSGTITSSPYQTLVAEGADPILASKLADVFAWQVDFYRIQPGDAFAIVYEEERVDDEPIGLGRVLAARFTHGGRDYYAFYFNDGEEGDYYDEEGNSLRKAFLKAPLKYSRISSRYSKRRFHPVLKRYKAHLGTDYAAPTGTPIHATGDGVIVAASYSRGNGNYVKIRHNSTYTTGYLHMSRIAKGIRPGVHVRQGDVIGYVGSTGLATGPHLCYRFWKNGRQVDPFREELPSGAPVPDSLRPAFEQLRDRYLPRLRLTSLQVASDPASDDRAEPQS